MRTFCLPKNKLTTLMIAPNMKAAIAYNRSAIDR